ncbi:MAG: tripartite tricarboxylate transporter substrate binding protein [Pseudomonadota bacterium]
MKLRRRQFFHLVAAAAALPIASRLARAQTYPARPVHWMVPWPPGGPADISARLIGRWLSERMGQPFIIENRSGAGGNIGTEAVVKSPPDGYTLLLVGSFNAINANLYDNLSFSFVRDIAPVAGIMRNPLVMEVHPTVPAKTVPEFIAYAKANPGKINMASGGNGSPQHVAGELFKMMAGIDMVHVPYRGSAPMLTDLIGGQVQVTFDPILSSLEHIRTSKLRPLAVTTTARSEALPDIPTVSEFLPGYETSGWTGIGVPTGTPAEIIERLNRQTNAGLADPKIKANLAVLGGSTFAVSPTEFGKFITDEVEKFAKVMKFAGIKPDRA